MLRTGALVFLACSVNEELEICERLDWALPVMLLHLERSRNLAILAGFPATGWLQPPTDKEQNPKTVSGSGSISLDNGCQIFTFTISKRQNLPSFHVAPISRSSDPSIRLVQLNGVLQPWIAASGKTPTIVEPIKPRSQRPNLQFFARRSTAIQLKTSLRLAPAEVASLPCG